MIIERKSYIAREKEFTSVAFKSKAVIGRMRRNLAKKIQESMDNDLNKAIKAGSIVTDTRRAVKSSRNIDKVVGKAAQKANASIKNITPLGDSIPKRGQNFTIDFNKLDKEQIDQLTSEKKLRNAYRRGKTAVISPKRGGGIEYRAHEVGHAMRVGSKNPITKLVRKYAFNPNTREVLNINSGDQGSKRGIKEAIKGYLKGSMVVAEEKAASKNALKLLKKGGMSKEDLLRSKNNLDMSLITYKKGRSRLWKSPLRELVEIPSRRIKE